MSDFPTGRFVWYDLMTSDRQAAQSFYTELIGWNTQPWEQSPMPYTMWARGDTTFGGVMQLPEDAPAPPHWLTYIATSDTDATAARAVELGGSIMMPPQDIPTVGKFAVIADPQGATFAAFTPAGEAPGHDDPPGLQEFSWHELITTDYEAAFSFYTDLFGWEKGEAMDMGEAGTYQMYGRAEVPLGGMFNKTAEMPTPPSWMFYISVENVHEAAKKVEALGGQILNGPMEVPGGDYIVQCLDPQGAAFALHHLAKSD